MDYTKSWSSLDSCIDLIREEQTNFPFDRFSLRKTANPIIIKSLQKLESVIGRKLIKE